ncbi:hypothetical protein PsorP6_000620 [Peronosclerospora sorghi]|uniref:Uncharacterized protein n=1 Tax=Peronosclerospora sorghi TaxID=230839 RepID=A0ACC0WWE9_9STRA|nr:hypothetical protein PsorP6_000620 [Peronosclerospora sorghi]
MSGRYSLPLKNVLYSIETKHPCAKDLETRPMTSIFSAGPSITSIDKSMTVIARVEEYLATFMKKRHFQYENPMKSTFVVRHVWCKTALIYDIHEQRHHFVAPLRGRLDFVRQCFSHRSHALLQIGRGTQSLATHLTQLDAIHGTHE